MNEENNNLSPTSVKRDPDPQASLRSIRNFLIAAALCWGVSMFFAGIILTTAGAICATIALRKTLRLEKSEPEMKDITKRFKILSIICLCVCVLAFIVTVASIAIALPAIIEAAQTGDFSKIMPGGSKSGSSGSSSW